MNRLLKVIVVGSSAFLFVLASCKRDKTDSETPSPVPTPSNPYSNINNTYGFGVMKKLCGIWNGPVSSSTPLGSYPEWIVDFRPISENQVSAKNELDKLNDIFMSFFIAKYNNEYRVCFRNGGSFNGMKRVSYFLADSISETVQQAYYRFSEIIKGKKRAYTEVIFKSDSLIIKSYTNKYNTLNTPVLHMLWQAKLQDTMSTQPAINNFQYPKKTLTKDFSNVFIGQQEAIYYGLTGDPYPENQQPYLGQSTIQYSLAPGFTPDTSKNVFIIITTQPLISGFTFNFNNLKTRSRYVILKYGDFSYTFNYMHPGTYYVYALYDNDNNNTFSSGDWVSASNTTFTLNPQSTTTVNVLINYTIP